jgi:hypothetical protein
MEWWENEVDVRGGWGRCHDCNTPPLHCCVPFHFTGSLLSWPLSRYTVREARAEA